MRAAVAIAFDKPLIIEDRPVPRPGPGQVLVRLEACGLCHTDIHAIRGDWPVKPDLPFVPGHEGVGIIEQLGDGVRARTVGQRVAMPWLGYACGECRYCIDGRENLCEQQRNTGYAVDGGYAEYALADARFAVPVPDDVSPFDAAPLTCAGVTTYAAIKAAKVVPGERVAVFGVGGLGHLAVQYARLVGAQVTAIDVTDAKLELALELGADHVVNALDVDPVQALTHVGGADVAVVLAVAPTVFAQAFASLNRGGRLILVSLPADGALTVPVFDTVLKGISIIGSIVGTRQDLVEVFALHAAGRTRVVAMPRSLENVNEAVDDVLSGEIPARLVFTYDGSAPTNPSLVDSARDTARG
ncbi:alcohol dehydrogenase catalytic domain-containing protein [Leifsonia poae]|uniref:Alcohol dehydrogenase n=1 Tax=Leifsonia poae TaxID=110933 RepID=A0A9W6HA40_9MICO|nr:zinc-dependent alcohol dehydrogenase [Leifsonia poae]GLJ76522.1 zinc-dependent alcohol dehydrogenase [Leifsonia poae]